MRKLRDLQAWNSISAKILFIIMCLVLPLNIFAIIVCDLSLRNVERQARAAVRNMMQDYLSDAQDRMDKMGDLLYSMQKNDSNAIIMVKQQSGHSYQMSKFKFYQTFSDTFQLTNPPDGAFYYMPTLRDVLVWNISAGTHSKSNMAEYIKRTLIAEEEAGWVLTVLPGGKGGEYPVLWQIRKQSNLYYGTYLDLNQAGSILEEMLPYTVTRFSFTETENPSASDETVVVTTGWEKPGLFFHVEIARKEINGGIYQIYFLVRIVAFLTLLLIPLLYVGISRLLLRPLMIIIHAHAELEKGNQDYQIYEKAASFEFQKSFDSFNRMAANIKRLERVNFEMALEKQKIEMRNLQLSIRPHFLINSFNLIYTLALRNDSANVRKTILYLSNYFRYIFKSSKETDFFRKEQNLIEGYIAMAKLRFPGSIEINYDYDPDIYNVRIPPLLIHSFIDNIIKHVVKPGLLTHITIMGQFIDRTVRFMIIDNGQGMDSDALSQVTENMKQFSLSGENVGIANAYRRLKNRYGEEASIELDSEIGVGTSVTVSFPYPLHLLSGGIE